MAILSVLKQVSFLSKIGLPAKTAGQRAESWKVFQAASAWHKFDVKAKAAGPLKVDGVPGTKTVVHVNASIAHRYGISPNFKLVDFKCRGYGHSHVSVDRDLVVYLQSLRAKIGNITVINGYRCAAYNASVGGIKGSEHTKWPARAVDIYPHPKPSVVKGLGFHGIGVRNTDSNPKTARVVVHLDINPKTPKDTVFVDE